MTRSDWDDDRLDAAFRARYDRVAPTTVAHEVHVRIAGTSPARRMTFGRGRTGWTLAAAAVVVVMLGMLSFSVGGTGPTAAPPSPSASGGQATSGPSATPTEQAIPGSVFGLPIVHVPEAIAIRDAGVDDREIAVLGWFTPPPPVSCGGDAGKTYDSPVVAHCPDELVWLSEDAGSYVHVIGNRLVTETPNGPALNPDLDGLDRSWFPELPVPGTDGGSTPVDVVLVGHFDDRRAMRCAATAQAACRDRFVVDSVAMVHGASTNFGPVYRNTAKASSSAADIEAIVNKEAPGSPILSMTVVDGPDGLVTFESSLSDGQEGLILQPTVWIVRVLESERISTYLVVDGSDAIYKMDPIGEAILVGGTPPTPHASPSAALSCGPLAPDTCSARAADVIAATPSQRVVSIVFGDRCGSDRVTFSDGTPAIAGVDCFIPPSPG